MLDRKSEKKSFGRGWKTQGEGYTQIFEANEDQLEQR